MTKYLENKKASLILIAVCFLTYSVIALTRNAYVAAIAGIIKEGYFSKTDAGVIATSFNITYCISQIAGSYFIDKISPFKIIVFGSVVTIFANLVMSLNPTYWSIFICRGICGIAQFGIWPSLLLILSEYINESLRHSWRLILPMGITVGTVLSYLGAAIISEWRGLFTLSYITMSIATVIFIITVIYADKKSVVRIEEKKSAEKSKIEKNKNEISVFKLLASSGAFFFIIPILSRNLIEGGVNSWMPTMLMETYGISPSFSSIMTTISTCAKFVAIAWVIIFYPKVFKLQTTAMGMFFLFMLPCIVISSLFIGKISIIWIVLSITLIKTLDGAIHQFFTVEIPGAYTKYNKAGMIAGLINSVATGAGVISGWLWGVMADRYSWSVIIWSWGALALVAVLSSFAATPLWKRYCKK